MTENFQSKSARTLYIYINMSTALINTLYSDTNSFCLHNQTIFLITGVWPLTDMYIHWNLLTLTNMYILTLFDHLLTFTDTE